MLYEKIRLDPNVVNIKNSLCMADKFAEFGLEFEMHIFPKGDHGMALANEITASGNEKNLDREISKWVQTAVAWADRF